MRACVRACVRVCVYIGPFLLLSFSCRQPNALTCLCATSVANEIVPIVDRQLKPNTLVVVLIDEVESLTAARSSALNGTEPSDAVRVVNAVLTQLDRLKRFKNVLTLCTTNLASAVDAAFLDRADVKVRFVVNSALCRVESSVPAHELLPVDQPPINEGFCRSSADCGPPCYPP